MRQKGKASSFGRSTNIVMFVMQQDRIIMEKCTEIR